MLLRSISLVYFDICDSFLSSEELMIAVNGRVCGNEGRVPVYFCLRGSRACSISFELSI